MDANIVERLILPITLNRKNGLLDGLEGLQRKLDDPRFADRDQQGLARQSASHLVDALTKIVNGHLNSLIDDLLPRASVTCLCSEIDMVAVPMSSQCRVQNHTQKGGAKTLSG